MLITAITDRNYQHYAPWFVFFLTKSYPEYKVKIYLTDEIVNKQAFELVKTDNVEYVENAFPEYPKSNQEIKTLLFLTKEEPEENVYMAGDIDVLICRENPTIENYHLKLCQLHYMVYNSFARYGSERIKTCSHFITPAYWMVMDKIIDRYRELHIGKQLNLGEYETGHVGNEHILYRMLEEAGMPIIPVPEEISVNIIHGLHLGVWRSENRLLPKYISLYPLYYTYWYQYFRIIAETEEYKRLYELLPLVEIKRMRENMDKYLSNATNKGV